MPELQERLFAVGADAVGCQFLQPSRRRPARLHGHGLGGEAGQAPGDRIGIDKCVHGQPPIPKSRGRLWIFPPRSARPG